MGYRPGRGISTGSPLALTTRKRSLAGRETSIGNATQSVPVLFTATCLPQLSRNRYVLRTKWQEWSVAKVSARLAGCRGAVCTWSDPIRVLFS